MNRKQGKPQIIWALILVGAVNASFHTPAAAEVPEDCPIPQWRQEKVKRDADVMIAASEAAQPTFSRPAGERSCISVFQDFGVDLSSSIPTSIGAIFDRLVKEAVRQGCKMADNWLKGTVRDMNRRLQGSIKDVPIVSGGIGTDGVDIGIDVSGEVDDMIRDNTGMRVNVPENRNQSQHSVPTHILGNL